MSGGAAAVIAAALRLPAEEVGRLHAEHINPTFIAALRSLGYGRDFVRGAGTRLWDAAGKEYLDCLSGYGALPLGHNPPEVIAALEEVLHAGLPGFLQVAPHALSSALAQRLARLTGGELPIAFFASSGSEAVDGALKLARAATRRPRFVYAERAFHGTTFGAVSVTGSVAARALFAPLLPGSAACPFGDAAAVERELRRRDVAAVLLEPMQGEGGMRPPPAGYLAEVRRLCRRYGSMLILDEIQTGLGRTGATFTWQEEGVVPDVLLVGKGLSGGLMPISAYLTTSRLWERAYGTLAHYDLHSTTFGGGALACAAALATVEIIERDGLPARARALGEQLGRRLRAAAAGHPLVREVRGRGLMWGVELQAPGPLSDLSAQWLAVGLMEQQVVTQVSVLAKGVLRVQPPLTIAEDDLGRAADAMAAVLAGPAASLYRVTKGAVGRIVAGHLGRSAP